MILMNKIIKNLHAVTLTILVISIFSSCVKKEFDTPPNPAGIDPNLIVTTTIAQLKAMYTIGGVPVRIVDDLVVSGIVVADDKSGNFYKELILQDATGGIAIQLDQSNYYVDFPVGRKVFVKLRNLYLGEYNGLIQLGGYYTKSGTYYNTERIPQSLISQHLIKGSYFHTIAPKVVSIYNLATNSYDYQNTLIKIKDVEFTTAFIGQPYANGPNFSDVNMEVEDCCGNLILLRTSDYSDFGYSLTPVGKGTMSGIFQVFGSDSQIKIRDLGDVSMIDARCGSGIPVPVGTGSLMNLVDVRNLFTGCTSGIATGTKIRGTVISDKNTANINSYNLVFQDGTGGIVVRFTTTNTFNLNDSLEIDLSGDSLMAFNGLVQISNVDFSDVTVLGTGNISPRVATVKEIFDNKSAWESTLVKVNLVTLSAGGPTYSGTVLLTDASGAIDLYTRSAATFASQSFPATGTHSVTGYVNQYGGTPELNIRDVTDVQ